MKQIDYIPLEMAKGLIVQALGEFEPELRVLAEKILSDENRLNVVEEMQPKTNMMACRPAGVSIEDIKAGEMLIPDFKDRFGPHFTRQDNPHDFAIIDFEYHGSPSSIIWLAHELGHAIADDLQRSNGRSFRNFSQSELENQAYFIQHIVSRYVREKLGELELTDDDLGEDILKMSWDRAQQFQNAKVPFEKALKLAAESRIPVVVAALDQRTADIA